MARWRALAQGGLAALGSLASGCGSTCIDDGFGGADCPAAQTSGAGSSDTGLVPGESDTLVLDDTSQGGTVGGSQEGTSLDGTGTDASTSSGSDADDATTSDDTSSSASSSSSGGLQPFCLDADGDGVADLDACVDADPDDPPPGHIPPGDADDCDDADPDVFPGAAASEPELCTIDADGDGWGSSSPPPGADAGSDCDDGSPFTFPGAADAEAPPLDTDCLRDEDDDGWGDDTPPPGVLPGSDCADTVPSLFPGAASLEPELCTTDADGDGWGDWGAPSLDPAADEGSDCDDADPLVERCALLVTQDGTAGAPLDAPLVPALQGLGLTVLLAEDALVTAADADPAVLVVISETVTSTDVTGEFRDVDEGAIVMEGLVWDDMDIAPSGTPVGSVTVTILDDTHPIAAGLSGIVGFMLVDPGSGVFHTAPGPGAQIVASRVPNQAHIVVFAFDAGVMMQNGFPAPARRVGFGADVDGGAGANGQLAPAGLAMFAAAASWAID
jgi:hypothetical protein